MDRLKDMAILFAANLVAVKGDDVQIMILNIGKGLTQNKDTRAKIDALIQQVSAK